MRASAGLSADQLVTLVIAGPDDTPLPLRAEAAVLVGFIAIGLSLAGHRFGATE